MPTDNIDVLGIGNAIVDVLSFCDDALLSKESLAKGSMMLIDEARAESLYAHMGPSTECSGGSVANTLAGLASLGANCAFTGKVKADQLGEIFRHDMRAVGVEFDTPAAESGPATARCLIFVTPDAQRTMNTFIGACAKVSESDIDAVLIERAEILYVEGYLWDQPEAIAAIKKAIAIAKQDGTQIAFTLSDTFCVERHREEFLALIENDLDLLFANEAEIKALFQTDDFNEAVAKLRQKIDLAAVTRGEEGCVVVTHHSVDVIPTSPVSNMVDTTGAGDLFAAGFLFGLTRDWDYLSCARLGNACAGEIIQQLGARSQKPLERLVA